MKEIWKDISGYEGLYQVSNLGDVRSLNYRRNGELKLLKQATNKQGYKQISLYKNGKIKTYKVHRLVAIAFIPNPNNLPVVNHKDENPSNNNVNNLEWCTVAYNNTYGTRTKRASESIRGENHPLYGKHHSKETKKKMSESNKGKNKGKHRSKETKKKISEKMKGKNNPASKPILMYDKEGNFIRRFNCIADAYEHLGKDRTCTGISECLAGRRKTMYGYVFKYAEENN